MKQPEMDSANAPRETSVVDKLQSYRSDGANRSATEKTSFAQKIVIVVMVLLNT